jgi:hypothetical protein
MKKLLSLILILGLFACSASVDITSNNEGENEDQVSSLPDGTLYITTGDYTYAEATLEEINQESEERFSVSVTEETLLNMEECPSFPQSVLEPGGVLYLDTVSLLLADGSAFRIYFFKFDIGAFLVEEPSSLDEIELSYANDNCFFDLEISEENTVELEGWGVFELVVEGPNLSIVPVEEESAYPDNKFYVGDIGVSSDFTLFEDEFVIDLINSNDDFCSDEGSCLEMETCSILGYVKTHGEGFFNYVVVDDVDEPTTFCTVNDVNFEEVFDFDSISYIGSYNSEEDVVSFTKQ